MTLGDWFIMEGEGKKEVWRLWIKVWRRKKRRENDVMGGGSGDGGGCTWRIRI